MKIEWSVAWVEFKALTLGRPERDGLREEVRIKLEEFEPTLVERPTPDDAESEFDFTPLPARAIAVDDEEEEEE